MLVLTLLTMLFLIIYYNHPLIRRNTPIMSIVVLIGLVFTALAGIFECLSVTTANCWLSTGFFIIGISLLIGGIIAKEYRIYRIFTNRSASAVQIKDSSLFMIVGGIVFYFSMILMTYYIAGLQAKIKQSKSNNYYSYYTCEETDSFWTTFLNIFLGVSSLIVRILAGIIAWFTRHVNSAYSESRQISIIVYTLICLTLILIPLLNTLKDGKDSAVVKTVIRMIDVIYTIAAVLPMLFFHRFYLVWKYEKRRSRRQSEIVRS